MDTVGSRIRFFRKDISKQTQREFGQRIGLKANSLSDIESGKNTATDQTIKAICREFAINEEWLRNGTEPMQKTIPRSEKLTQYLANIALGDDDFIQDFIEIYMDLDQTSKDALKKIVKGMVEKRK